MLVCLGSRARTRIVICPGPYGVLTLGFWTNSEVQHLIHTQSSRITEESDRIFENRVRVVRHVDRISRQSLRHSALTYSSVRCPVYSVHPR